MFSAGTTAGVLDQVPGDAVTADPPTKTSPLSDGAATFTRVEETGKLEIVVRTAVA